MRDSGINRLCWWLVDIASLLLDPGERAVVRGDFAESGESAGQALRGVLGLVLRRQAEPWREWRPWPLLLFLIVPMGMGLSRLSRMAANESSIFLWMYRFNWTAISPMRPWERVNLVRAGAITSVSYLILLCWSFTIGFALASLWRRLVWSNGFLFCAVLFYGLFSGTAQPYRPWNEAVFSLFFYSTIYPAIVQIVVVMMPALWGMREGGRAAALPPLCGAFACSSAIMAIAPWVLLGMGVRRISHLDLAELALLAALAPILYACARAFWRRRHSRPASLVQMNGGDR
jgi:hypothetical protein